MTAPAVARHTTLERWLTLRGRRMLLVAAGVLVLSGLTTHMWLDAAAELGWSPDGTQVFLRRLLRWGLWGLAVEPLLSVGKLLAVRVRWWVLLLPIHVVLSVLVADGMSELYSRSSDVLFPRSPWSSSSRESGVESDDVRRRSRGFSGRLSGRSRETGMALYWTILGLGWGVDASLRRRKEERRTDDLELKTAQLETDLLSAQLSNLRNQIHPHFLFNTLHSLGGLIREERGPLALSVLTSLSELLRAALETERRQWVPLHTELQLAEQYLDIERLRLGDRLVATTHLDAGLGDVSVPSLILLPILENAVTHGIAVRPAGGHVEISARATGSGDDAALVLEVVDDGPGFPPAVLADGTAKAPGRTAIGLANTRLRLAKLYDDRGRMELSNRPEGGARVVITIPRTAGSRT